VHADEIQSRILAFLGGDLRIAGIDVESRLVSTGVLDSSDLVRLASFLERSFEIEIPDQDVSADRFDTVAMAIEYVLARRGRS
jgi:acyl carrier protein